MEIVPTAIYLTLIPYAEACILPGKGDPAAWHGQAGVIRFDRSLAQTWHGPEPISGIFG